MARVDEYRLSLKTIVERMDPYILRRNLVDAIHSLNCVATGLDSEEEMTLEEMKAGARGLLISLGFEVWEEANETD